nr:ABC transporter substrate-binding protein [uncultured Niameybacter sp.]
MVGKKLLALSSILVSMSLFVGCAGSGTGSTNEGKAVNIGITQIASHPALDASREGFLEALAEKGYKEGENLNIELQNAEGDIATAQLIATNFTSSKKDLIFAIATPAAQVAFNTTKDIPIIVTAVTDAKEAGLVQSNEKSGTNVAGTSDAVPIEQQVKLIRDLFKDAKTIGVLYNTSEVNSEIQVNDLKEAAKANGFEVVTKGITSVNDISQALDAILGSVDVLYTPADNLVASSMAIIAAQATDKKVPVVGAEEAHVQNGALITEGISYKKLGYEAGLMAVQVLEGSNISELPVKKSEETQLVINEDTMNKLAITIDQSIMERATLIKGGE